MYHQGFLAFSRAPARSPGAGLSCVTLDGSIATFDWHSKSLQQFGGETVDAAGSGDQFEELVDELNLTSNVSSAHPTSLPLPDHVHRLITLNRTLRRLEFSEPLLGVHPPFDRAAILLQDIVQVLHGSVPITAA